MSGDLERRGARPPDPPNIPVASPTPAPTRQESFGTQHPGGRYGFPAGGGQPGALHPEWVMAGVDVPAGKRLYASRDLKGSAFEVAVDEHFNGDGWHLTTTMQRMLVITRPTYAECLAELMTIWRNWDSEGRELPAGRQHRSAI